MNDKPNTSRARFWALNAIVFVLAAGVAFAFNINLCDLVYDCGCRSLWNGAADACNIHDPTTHDCPWCVTGNLGAYLPLGLVLAAQAAVSFWPSPMRLWFRAMAALLAFPIVGGAAGIGFGLATGYWF